MTMMTIFMARLGHPVFHGGVLVILLIALVALIVMCWPAKTDSK